MKKTTILLLLLLTTTIGTAQQLYVEGGKTLSSFDYKNSQGEGIDNLQSTTKSFMALGFRSQFFTKNLNIAMGINYAGYGTIGSDDTVGNYMEWDVNYAGLNVDLEYHLIHIKKASFYIKAGMSASFFVQGTQTLNSTVIDLKGSDDFDTTKIGLNAGVGVVGESITSYFLKASWKSCFIIVLTC